MKKYMKSLGWDFNQNETIDDVAYIFETDRMNYLKLVSLYGGQYEMEAKMRSELQRKMDRLDFFFITLGHPRNGTKMVAKIKMRD